MGSQLDPLPLSRIESQERLPSPNFPQLHFGEPSSGFTPGLGSASPIAYHWGQCLKHVHYNGRMMCIAKEKEQELAELYL